MSTERVERWFTYHAPTDDQIPKYQALRAKAKEYADVIEEMVPEGSDKEAAFWWLRSTNMAANAAIACQPVTNDQVSL